MHSRDVVPLNVIYPDVQPGLANSNCNKCVMSKLFYHGRQSAKNKHKRPCNHSEDVLYNSMQRDTKPWIIKRAF